jgi:hypothetical protein
MRAWSEISFHTLLALALTGIFVAGRAHRELVVLDIIAALAVYVAVYLSPLRWTMPRRRRHVPSFAVCFLGAFVVTFLTLTPAENAADEITLRAVVAALSGAFAFLYAAVKIGVPTHVGVVVNAQSVSSHTRDGAPDFEGGRAVARDLLARGLFDVRKLEAPDVGIWPEHFEVAQEGSITWFIHGRPGTRATIRFDRGFDPFREPGGDESFFVGVVPAGSAAVITAGPVVSPGRGAYSIELEAPGEGEGKRVHVHGGGSQRKG